MDSTDNYLQLGDKNNVVGYDASEIENHADMRGDDTIIGGSEKNLIIDYPGADSLIGAQAVTLFLHLIMIFSSTMARILLMVVKVTICSWLMMETTPPVALEAMLLWLKQISTIRFDEPIEQDANPDRVIMTYDSRADETNVYADGKKFAEIFGVYPNGFQDYYLGNFSRIAYVFLGYRCGDCDKSSYWRNFPTYPLTNCEILLNSEFSYENQYAHDARSPYQL